MKRHVLIIAAAIVTFGCASPPKHKYPNVQVDVPEEWTATETTDTLSAVVDTTRWWIAFDDPALDTLVDEALANNYNLKSAVARVDAAAAIARIAGADLWPQASLGFNASRAQQNLIGLPIPGSDGIITTRSSSFGVSLDVGWEIDLWGRVRSGQSAALADFEASWADLAGLRLSIAAQTVKAWFALIESRLQLELAETTVETFKLSADQVRRRYEQGVRSSLDLRLALANYYGAEALLESRKEQLDRATRQLEILLGRYPAGSLATEDDLPTIAAAVPQGLPSEVLIRRPDLLAAERRFTAAEKRVSQARRAFFPRISLTGAGGTLAGELENIVKGDFSVWRIAANVTQPIFQGGRLRANLAQSHAVSDQILAEYALALLTAFGEVESSLTAEQILTRRVAVTAEAAEQSEAARVLAEKEYNAGLTDYITVLETQRRELNARSELLTVRRQRLDARVNLHLALGGGFDLETDWKQFLETQNESEESGD